MKLRGVFLTAALSAGLVASAAIAQPVQQPAELAAAALERIRSSMPPRAPGLPDPTAPDQAPLETSPPADAPRSEITPAEPASAPPPRAAAPSRPERSALPAPGSGQVHRVGRARALKRPSDAAQLAKPGDIVEIDAGVYSGDVAVWSQSNLIIRGVGGKAELKAAGQRANNKGIWVIRGNNVVVEDVEFSGARAPDKNGAGIRVDGDGITVRNCKFYDNEMGILTNNSPNSDVVIEGSEFYENTVDYQKLRSLGHNVYVGRVRSFTLRNSYIHHAHIGHNVKSRAKTNYILFNRVMDEADGSASYLIDFPEGGTGYIVGNVMHKSVKADNQAAISFAAEKKTEINANDRLFVVNNTIVIDQNRWIFVQNRSVGSALVANNILVGRSVPITGPGRVIGNLFVEGTSATTAPSHNAAAETTGTLKGNWTTANAGFVDQRGYDYRLTQKSPAIDRGLDLTGESAKLIPADEYVHPLKSQPRKKNGPLDIGAHEYVGSR